MYFSALQRYDDYYLRPLIYATTASYCLPFARPAGAFLIMIVRCLNAIFLLALFRVSNG